jgi:hypothetical protein
MKKGTRVRVLRTNEIGTIACTELIRKNGQVRQYCKVKLDKNPELDTWFFANQLGDTKECATVTLADRRGRKLIMSVTQHYDKSPGKNDMNIVLKAEGDGNLRDHEGGLHFFLAAFLMKALVGESDE